MGDSDIGIILQAITALQGNIENRFIQVFDSISRVDDRVESLEMERKERETRDCIEEKLEIKEAAKEAKEAARHIDWAKVRQNAVFVASASLTVAAIGVTFAAAKFLLLNTDKWIK